MNGVVAAHADLHVQTYSVSPALLFIIAKIITGHAELYRLDLPTVLLRQRLCSSLFFNDITCTILSELIELVRHIALRGWEQVGVVVGDIDAFVSHPVGNSNRRKTLVDQKTDVAVS